MVKRFLAIWIILMLVIALVAGVIIAAIDDPLAFLISVGITAILFVVSWAISVLFPTP